MRTTLTLGDVTIHRVVEIEAGTSPARHTFPALTAERLGEVRGWMRPAALDADDNLLLCFQSFIVRTPRHTVLVDSCVGNDKESLEYPIFHRRSGGAWMHGLASAGLTVDDIDVVVCTHLHLDHIGWNTRLDEGRWVPTFPNARYLFSGKELDYALREHARVPSPSLRESVIPIIRSNRADLIDNDHVVDDHLRILSTPGHTIDHLSVEVGRPGNLAIITGDMIHSPLQARYPELTSRIEYDAGLAIETRRAFLETHCDTDTIVCFTHFPSPSWGRVRRWDDGFRSETVV